MPSLTWHELSELADQLPTPKQHLTAEWSKDKFRKQIRAMISLANLGFQGQTDTSTVASEQISLLMLLGDQVCVIHTLASGALMSWTQPREGSVHTGKARKQAALKMRSSYGLLMAPLDIGANLT